MLFYRKQDYVPKAQRGTKIYNEKLDGQLDTTITPNQGMGALGFVGGRGALKLGSALSKYFTKAPAVSKYVQGLDNFAKTGNAYSKIANPGVTRGATKLAATADKARKAASYGGRWKVKAGSVKTATEAAAPSYLKYAAISILGASVVGFMGKLRQDYNNGRFDEGHDPKYTGYSPTERPTVNPAGAYKELPVAGSDAPASAQPKEVVKPIVAPVVKPKVTVADNSNITGASRVSGGAGTGRTRGIAKVDPEVAARDARIKAIQRGYGFTGDAVDGIWGKDTQAAYEAAKIEQEALGFKGKEIDGIIGNKTRERRIAAGKKLVEDKALKEFKDSNTITTEADIKSKYGHGNDGIGIGYKKGGIFYGDTFQAGGVLKNNTNIATPYIGGLKKKVRTPEEEAKHSRYQALSGSLDAYENSLKEVLKGSFTTFTAGLGSKDSKKSIKEYESELADIPRKRLELLQKYMDPNFKESDNYVWWSDKAKK